MGKQDLLSLFITQPLFIFHIWDLVSEYVYKKEHSPFKLKKIKMHQFHR